MSNDSSSTAASPENPDYARGIYPYLVIRMFAVVYQREGIQIRVGPPLVELIYRRCFVQHPVQFTADGTLNPDCRELLTSAVQAAVRRLGFRVFIVWAESSCTSVEAHRISKAGVPSGGRAPFEIEYKPQHYEPAPEV